MTSSLNVAPSSTLPSRFSPHRQRPSLAKRMRHNDRRSIKWLITTPRGDQRLLTPAEDIRAAGRRFNRMYEPPARLPIARGSCPRKSLLLMQVLWFSKFFPRPAARPSTRLLVSMRPALPTVDTNPCMVALRPSLGPTSLDCTAAVLRGSRSTSTNLGGKSGRKAIPALVGGLHPPARFSRELRRRSAGDPVFIRLCGRLAPVNRHWQPETIGRPSGWLK